MSSPPRVARDGDVASSLSDGILRLRVHEEGGATRSFTFDTTRGRGARRVPLLVDHPNRSAGEPSRGARRARHLVDHPNRGVADPSSRAGRLLIKDSARRRVVCDRRRLPLRQTRKPAVRATPTTASDVNPRGVIPPSPADELFGVYKDGRLLYLASRGKFILADHPGVGLSSRVGTTSDGVDYGDIVRPARSRSLPGRSRAEGVHRRGCHHRAPSADEPIDPYNLLEDATDGLPIFAPKKSYELKFDKDGNADMTESFGKLTVSEVRKEFLKMEKSFIYLIESGEEAIEREIADSIHSLAQDSQAWEEYIALSEPSSESDNSEADPSYEPEGSDDDQGTDDCGSVQGNGDGDDGSDSDDEDDEDEDDEEEDEEEEEQGDAEEDLNYDPTYDNDEDDDDEYMNGVALLPPLPPGAEYWKGVTVVHRIASLQYLNPEFHILGFGPDLTIHQRVRLWATGDAMGFDFHPSEMLRYVWRMYLLLKGENPGNRSNFRNEPPVPNPGDYDDEGWKTDDDELVGSDMEVEDWDLDSVSSDMEED